MHEYSPPPPCTHCLSQALWKTAIDAEDAAKKALQDSLDAGAAAAAAEARANEAEPAYFSSWLLSSETLENVTENAKRLREEADDAKRKFVMTDETAKALLRHHHEHVDIVQNLTRQVQEAKKRAVASDERVNAKSELKNAKAELASVTSGLINALAAARDEYMVTLQGFQGESERIITSLSEEVLCVCLCVCLLGSLSLSCARARSLMLSLTRTCKFTHTHAHTQTHTAWN